jgi:hypothetical protein
MMIDRGVLSEVLYNRWPIQNKSPGCPQAESMLFALGQYQEINANAF